MYRYNLCSVARQSRAMVHGRLCSIARGMIHAAITLLAARWNTVQFPRDSSTQTPKKATLEHPGRTHAYEKIRKCRCSELPGCLVYYSLLAAVQVRTMTTASA